jgi:hypothetical protein
MRFGLLLFGAKDDAVGEPCAPIGPLILSIACFLCAEEIGYSVPESARTDFQPVLFFTSDLLLIRFRTAGIGAH